MALKSVWGLVLMDRVTATEDGSSCGVPTSITMALACHPIQGSALASSVGPRTEPRAIEWGMGPDKGLLG